MKSGIYEIRNTVNGKRYIGSAVNFKKRWVEHARRLGRNDHHSRHLQSAWNKYGSDVFRFRLVRSVPRCYLIAFEQSYIDRANPEYNMSPTAGSALGIRRNEAFRAKISATSKGRSHTPEARAQISANLLGRKKSPEHCANIGAAKRGKKYMLGYKHSPEALAKISAAHKGKIISRETRGKMAAAKLGKTMHPKTRAAILAANTGSKRTPEQRAKMSESAKRRWNKPN